MIIRKWLIINSNRSARLTTGRPSMRSDELSMLLEVNLPDELFRKPRLEAKITIPKEAAAKEVITANVIENVQEAIRQSTGLEFHVNVVKDPEPGQEEICRGCGHLMDVHIDEGDHLRCHSLGKDLLQCGCNIQKAVRERP